MMHECKDLNVTLQADPDRLPYADQSFGFVTAVCVFHHVEVGARPALVREIARTLEPGGYACLIEHNPYNPVTRAIVRRAPIDANASLLTPPMVSELFSNNGFEVERTTFFLYLPERLYRYMPALERLLASVPLGGQFATFARKPERRSS
jgi:SAM-dependent methyltransferase